MTDEPPTVHVWLLRPEDVPTAALRCLDTRERSLAERQKVASAARVRAASYALLRHALSAVEGRPPEAWRFERGTGRPRVLDSDVSFSLSRTVGLVGVAVADGAVGLDVERVIPIPDLDEVVRDHFASGDREHLANLPPEQRTRTFYEIWTQAEAVLKGEGMGIIDGIEVPDEVSARWRVTRLDRPASHCVAVATGSTNYSDPTIRLRSDSRGETGPWQGNTR